MSKISFKNFPPPQDTIQAMTQQAEKNPHWFATPMSRWVKDKFTKAFGVVQTNDGNQIVVKWSTGLESVETGENIEPAVATEYMAVIKSFAVSELNMDEAAFTEAHRAVVKELDAGNIYSMEVLTKLEEDLMAKTVAEVDADYENAWATVEETAAGLTEDDVFAAFGVDSSEPPKPTAPVQDVTTTDSAVESPHRVTAGPDDDHPGTFAVFYGPDKLEQFFDTLDEALAEVPVWRKSIAEDMLAEAGLPVKKAPPAEKPGKPMCALCGKVGVNKNSPDLNDGRKICKKCQMSGTITSEVVGAEIVDYFPGAEPEQKTAEVRRFYVAALGVGDVIWGIGSSIYEAQTEAEKLYTDETGFPSEEDFEVYQATEALFENVKTYGGECSWTINEETGIASTMRRVPRSAPVAEEKPSTTIDTVDTATTATSTPERSTEEASAKSEDPKQSGTVAASSENNNVSNEIAQDAQTAEASATTPIQTEQGLVDPETGEVLEPSFILSKLGWAEWPTLSANPTHAELEAFEAKLDQVTDKMLTHVDRTSRYRAACEERCLPYDKAAEFWFANFVTPLGKQLGPHRLPKNKKGEFKSKTLKLASGLIKFVKQGGAYVHEAALVKEHIIKEGIEAFKSIDADYELKYSYRKLIAAINKGELKDVPGTGTREANHFAKVKVVSPSGLTLGGGDEEDDAE